MKLYIWNYLDVVTDNYHSGGGLIICTNKDPLEVWKDYASGLEDYAGKPFPLELPEPDREIEVAENQEEFLEIYGDVGCC